METKILSGKECSASVNAETQAMAAEFTAKYGMAPALAVILIGDDPASCVYVNSKAQKCVELGLRSEKFLLDKDATMEQTQQRPHYPRYSGAVAASAADRRRKGDRRY